MSINGLLVFILSAIFGLAFMCGKFWSYDKCSTSDLSDNIKILYILIDTFKDIMVLFYVLVYLLYKAI